MILRWLVLWLSNFCLVAWTIVRVVLRFPHYISFFLKVYDVYDVWDILRGYNRKLKILHRRTERIVKYIQHKNVSFYRFKTIKVHMYIYECSKAEGPLYPTSLIKNIPRWATCFTLKIVSLFWSLGIAYLPTPTACPLAWHHSATVHTASMMTIWGHAWFNTQRRRFAPPCFPI